MKKKKSDGRRKSSYFFWKSGHPLRTGTAPEKERLHEKKKNVKAVL